MIKALKDSLVEDTQKVLFYGWSGNADEVLKYIDPGFSLTIPEKDFLIHDRSEIIKIILAHKNDCIKIGRQQYEAPYSRRQVCIVFGRYQITNTDGIRHTVDIHNVVAFWYKNSDNSVKLVNLAIKGGKANTEPIHETAHKKICMKDINGNLWSIPEDDIIYFTSDGNYVHVVCTDMPDPIKVRSSTEQFFQKCSDRFRMLGRSNCLNIDHVNAVQSSCVVMSNGDLIPVSKRMHARVVKMLQ